MHVFESEIISKVPHTFNQKRLRTFPESSPKKESQMQKWNMWEGWRSLIEIEDCSSGGGRVCWGWDLSCDWLPPPPHGKVLGPHAAAELRVRRQRKRWNWAGAVIHSCGRCISERTSCLLWHPPRTPASIFICSNLRVSDAALTHRSGRTAAHSYRGKSPTVLRGELGYREEFGPGSLSVEVSYDALLLKNVALLLFCAECFFLRAGAAKSALDLQPSTRSSAFLAAFK